MIHMIPPNISVRSFLPVPYLFYHITFSPIMAKISCLIAAVQTAADRKTKFYETLPRQKLCVIMEITSAESLFNAGDLYRMKMEALCAAKHPPKKLPC